MTNEIKEQKIEAKAITNEKKTSEANQAGGIVPQGAIYSKIATRYVEILETLFALLKDEQASNRLGAAKVLINKIVPDLKALEVKGEITAKHLINIDNIPLSIFKGETHAVTTYGSTNATTTTQSQ